MSKKFLTFLTLVLFMNFLISCTIIGNHSNDKIRGTYSFSKITANKFPEIQLITTSGDPYKGKLLSLEGEKLKLLPFPYWNVESVEIDIDEIHSIELMKKDSKAGKGAAQGFAYTFLIVGIIAGLDSEYDEDYEDALVGATILGAFGGLLGLIIGGASSLASKTKYEFYKMSLGEKIRAIRKIMGL